MVEITDYESAWAWAAGQPHEAQLAFSVRCALRALPGLGTTPFDIMPTSLIWVFRAELTSGVAAMLGSAEVPRPLSSCLATAPEMGSFKGRALAALEASTAAVGCALRRSEDSAYRAAIFAADAAIQTPEARKDAVKSTILSMHNYDAIRIENFGLAVFQTNLFRREGVPDFFQEPYARLLHYWDTSPRIWGFWRRWYEGMLRGEPLPWDLQREVALIHNAIWEAGPEALAEEIERIEARFELLRRIEELEAERDALKASRFGIGGNQPPERIDDPELAQQLTIIWDATHSIKSEAQSKTPDRSVVQSAIDALAASLKWLLAFCGRMGEHALKVGITVSVTAGMAKVMNPELLDAAIKAARAWLQTF